MKPLPGHVWRALRFAGKVGFLSRTLWMEIFGIGEKRWREKQFVRLVERGLIEKCRNPAIKDYYILTEKARRLLMNQNQSAVSSPHISQFHHDEVVARSLLLLEWSGIVAWWRTESELKRAQVKEYLLNNDVQNKKYPDAVITVRVNGGERTVALEYERTAKASLRYKTILWEYSLMGGFSMILFVCENETIKRLIKSRMDYMRLPDLCGRVAFADVAAWRGDPGRAPIRLGEKTFTFESLGQKFNTKSPTIQAANLAA